MTVHAGLGVCDDALVLGRVKALRGGCIRVRRSAFVTAEIHDQNGIFVPAATNSISFAVESPGRIVGVDTGNAIDTTSYEATTRDAFSAALAIMQSAGPIKVPARPLVPEAERR